MEPVNEAKVLQEQKKHYAILESKYKAYIGPLRESFNRRGKRIDEMALAAVMNCLNNFDMDMRGMNEATKTVNVGTFIQHGYDLITAVYPNLVLNNIASIQPLNNRSGEIWFYNLLYETAKGTNPGNIPGISATTGVRPDMRYSSEMITLAVTGAINGSNATFTANVPTAARPVRTNAGGDGILVTDGVEIFSLNAAGTGLVGNLGGTGTYDPATGAISVTFATAPATGSTVVAMAKTTFEDKPDQIGKTKISLVSQPIYAQKHALISDYTLDSEYDLNRNFNMNVADELIKGTAALIRAEIDQLGMYEIKLAARNPTQSASASNTWNGTVPTGIAQLDHFRTLLTMWKNQSNDIYNATRMVHGNFVIVGNDIATVIEVLPEFKPNPAITSEMQNSGPYVAGTISSFIVIKNPDFDPVEWVVGNRGVGAFNTGYIVAPYRGLMVTPPISAPTNPFSVTRGMYLEAGRAVVNAKFYSYGRATNITF